MMVIRHVEEPDATELSAPNYNFRYNPTKNRFEARRLIAGQWYTEWARPAFNFEENFVGYLVSGLSMISQNVMYSGTVGGGSAAVLQEPTGGIRLTTGAGGGSSTYIGSGAGAIQNFYRPNKEVYSKFLTKIPDAPSLLYNDWFIGFYYDGDNYIGWNYIADATIDQWFLITRSGGVETTTKVGEPPTTDLITLRLFFNGSLVRGWFDDRIVIEHTTNIPDETMGLLCNCANREAAVKNADLTHISILNDL